MNQMRLNPFEEAENKRKAEIKQKKQEEDAKFLNELLNEDAVKKEFLNENPFDDS